MRFHLLAMTIWSMAGPTLVAADLSKVDRSIQKEPNYQNTPLYCLVVVGPLAANRMWIVLDGALLYVDRNGNGDITEPGERVECDPSDGYNNEYRKLFRVGKVILGGREHRQLNVIALRYSGIPNPDDRLKKLLEKEKEAWGLTLSLDVDVVDAPKHAVIERVPHIAGYQDFAGYLCLTKQAKDAPIIHCNGRLTIGMTGPHLGKIGRELDVVLGVGTPGLGAGTTAWIAYADVIPEAVHPKVEITYPNKEPDEIPVKEFFELKQRC